MHRDLGIGKLGQAGKEVPSWLLGNGHDHIRGPGSIDNFLKAIEPTQNRNRMAPRVDRQMSAPHPRLGELVMAGVHESDDRYPPTGGLLQVVQQLAGVSPSTYEDDPGPGRVPDQPRLALSRELQGIIHELPPIRRLIARITLLVAAAAEDLSGLFNSWDHPWSPPSGAGLAG
jgi:hypothetical protein